LACAREKIPDTETFPVYIYHFQTILGCQIGSVGSRKTLCFGITSDCYTYQQLSLAEVFRPIEEVSIALEGQLVFTIRLRQ